MGLEKVRQQLQQDVDHGWAQQTQQHLARQTEMRASAIGVYQEGISTRPDRGARQPNIFVSELVLPAGGTGQLRYGSAFPSSCWGFHEGYLEHVLRGLNQSSWPKICQ